MKRRTKILLGTFITVDIIIAAVFLCSPYGRHEGFDYKLIPASVDIAAPPGEVFAYLGNSGHAKDWSVYVDHITPLNSDSFPDGAVGSRRRCFQQADEQGTWWDELITIVEPGKRRQLTIYNMHGFPMSADGLATEQLYTPLENGTKCRLTFTVFFSDHDPGAWDAFKTYLGAYKIKSIFEKNLASIKRIVEQQRHE